MVAESTVRFQGNLQVQDDPRNWIRAVMVLHPSKIDLTSGDQSLGSWPLSQVAASRLEGDRFQLTLGEETAVFAADDALGFSYEALPRLNKKSMLGSIGKLFAAKKDSEGGAEAAPAEETSNGDGEVFTFTLRDVMATAEDWDDQGVAAAEPADVAVDTEQVSLDAEIAALELSVAQVDEQFEPEALDLSPAALDPEPLVVAPSEPEPVPEHVAETDGIAEPEQVAAPKPSAPQEPEPTERLHLALTRLLEAVEQKKFPPQHLDRINDLIQSVTALMEATRR
ncbi:MAG TPA: hypothetical protein VID03_07240 [Acidimicrobiia bacterium]|jgi:hypothetical protein